MHVSGESDLHFSLLCASIRKAQAHDGSYPHIVISMIHRLTQQCVGWVTLVLHTAIGDTDCQQGTCKARIHMAYMVL